MLDVSDTLTASDDIFAEIIFGQHQPIGGGGYVYSSPTLSYNKYKIRIVVTRKGKTWECSEFVDETSAKVYANVINRRRDDPIIKVHGKMIESKHPEIKIKRLFKEMV